MSSAPLQQESTQAYIPGTLVWVPIREGGPQRGGKAQLLYSKQRVQRWVKGRVLSVIENRDDGSSQPLLTVEAETGEVVSDLGYGDCPLRNDNDESVDDLVKSDFLHEPGILNTLRQRYSLDMIYTYSAHILIAANPHKRLRHLLGPRMMAQYRGVQLGELSPHAYAIAEQAFSSMMIDEQRQAILISGESGAGKTESAKTVMQYLANRGQGQKGALLNSPSFNLSKAVSVELLQPPDNQSSAPIEEQVLESNPLLEAFGNARTSRNENSSRFGKFVEMYFDLWGRVTGASINTYLLERSRVVAINSPERSYHIFYQLIAGADFEQRRLLRLTKKPQDFRYLAGSDTVKLSHVDDAEEFRRTLDAMKIIGLSEDDQDAVLRVVAAILHLGNIVFEQKEYECSLNATSVKELEIVADLLQVDAESLRHSLLTRTIETVGEKITKYLEAGPAAEARDAFAKNVYAKLFDWLVAAVNRKISTKSSGIKSPRTIGILDIYGFESFKENSFEQLCINLANERLQQQFNQHVFKGEQDEYQKEGIDWSYVEFIDNQDCLDLLEGKAGQQGPAVFPIIDEACRMPRATAEGLAHTLRTKLVSHNRFLAPNRPHTCFVVDHYAGRVMYSCDALLDKNKDFVVAEHAALLANSKNEVIVNMFAPDPEEEAPAEAPPPGRGRREVKSTFKFNSVGFQFRKQLAGLMATLNECHPHYIRCIKPNPESKPGNLVPDYVLEQLRAGGVLEAVRIACAGFPTRREFVPFAQRYALLLSHGRYEPCDWESEDPDAVIDVCRKVLQSMKMSGWQLGKTRIFLRAGQLAQLEGARGRKITRSAVLVQTAWRRFMAMKEYKRMRAHVALIQRWYRGHLARKRVKHLRREGAALRLQTYWRMSRLRRKFVAQRRTRAAILIQSFVRMHLQRQKFLRETLAGKRARERAARRALETAAVVKMQTHWRAVVARRKLAKLRYEAVKFELMTAERDGLLVEVGEWKERAAAAERRVEDMDAIVARLKMEMEAQRLEAYSRSAEQVEAAQAAAKAALIGEMMLLRQQKDSSEQTMKQLQDQVRELGSNLKAKTATIAEMTEVSKDRELESKRLMDNFRQASERFEAEIEAKDAEIKARDGEIAALKEALYQAQSSAAAEIMATKDAMQVELERQKAEFGTEMEAVRKELEGKKTQLGSAQQMNVHFSARVMALNARIAKMEREVTELKTREQLLVAENKQAHKLGTAHSLGRIRTSTNGMAEAGMESLTPPALTPARSARSEVDQSMASSGSESLPPLVLRTSESFASQVSANEQRSGDYSHLMVSEYAGLDKKHEGVLQLLVKGAVEKRLQIVNVQHGVKPSDSIGMPVAAWIIGESLLRWASIWTTTEMDIVAIRVKNAVVSNSTDLQLQAYWLSTSLALGAFLRVRSIGRRDIGNLFKLGDDMIHFGALHKLLALSIKEMVPVDISSLLSSKVKQRQLRHSRSTVKGGATGDAARDYESFMNSPWKGLLGGLSNVVESLRGEGTPASAVRAVVQATLSYINAELLNALLLRRECCSISSVKTLQSGLTDLKSWFTCMGPHWCGEATDVDRALEQVNQAVKYLLMGKDNLVAKTSRGADVIADLRRMCPKLTLQQVYKLTEHHHDDWIGGGYGVGGGSGNQTYQLLEVLKQQLEDSGGGGSVAPGSPTSGRSDLSSANLSTDGSRMDDEDGLLLDPLDSFVLPRRLLTEAARQFVQAPRSPGQHGNSPMLSQIEKACRSVQLPRQLRNSADFKFLTAAPEADH